MGGRLDARQRAPPLGARKGVHQGHQAAPRLPGDPPQDPTLGVAAIAGHAGKGLEVGALAPLHHSALRMAAYRPRRGGALAQLHEELLGVAAARCHRCWLEGLSGVLGAAASCAGADAAPIPCMHSACRAHDPKKPCLDPFVLARRSWVGGV